MNVLKLHHIGEPLVATMLQRLEAGGRLSNLRCPRTNVSFEEDIAAQSISRPLEFLPEKAALSVERIGKSCSCDGAQKVDVLCVGNSARAIALELKLGEERLRANEFKGRFLKVCAPSHGESRIKGSMISVLDRLYSWSEETVLRASTASGNWEVMQSWWLVVRNMVWTRWEQSVAPELNNARILILEDLVQELGGEEPFNDLVRELVCENFFRAWRLNQ